MSIGLQLHPEPKCWIDALEYCHTKNSSLVRITNCELCDTVNQLLQHIEGLQEGVWIGLERSIFGCKPVWKWLSGEIHAQGVISSRENPTNNYCGKILWDGKTNNIAFLDEDCFKPLPFICQDPP
ncbi:hypothetical protein Q8A73_006729 [Channa argus]|nr:hypothetical protein Q8A73_006729 [Channa argus]